MMPERSRNTQPNSATDHPRCDDPGFGIYVHWPFCQAKCPYCDFNSHVRRSVDEASWRAALLRELEHMAGRAPARTVTSVFFGGGTPSLMEPETVGAVIERVAALWPVAGDVEVTLEANPTSVEARRFRGYRAAGVNRLSVGVQALDGTALKALGRLHTVEEALAAIELARTLFPAMSFDLIYARPGQSVAAWTDELNRALAHARDHLSLYQLTIEPGTPFYDLHVRGALQIPGENLAAALFEATQETMAAAGYSAYEISNHARPGAESRHNLTYWRYGDYAGVGPGAHSRIGGQALAALRAPEAWLESVKAWGHGLETEEVIAPDVQASEFLLMGLRLAEGIDPVRYARLAGRPLAEDRLAALMEDGLLERRPDGCIAATLRGRLVLNAVIAALAS